ncbi:uncharacterized protein LOC118757300 [Rhagoletis pomonella]|uniref:uncharacterized protein LOC118757300 n=1 Tax=Rhagoletis pomonella TaxID=28610 RepID=UPI001780C85A|nr:uncharacterized protein LOC118757300 [Rhagoletis pomonella]
MQNGVYPDFAKLTTLSESTNFTGASKFQAPEMRLPEGITELEARNEKLGQNLVQTNTMAKGFYNARNDNLSLDIDGAEICTPHSNTRKGFDNKIAFARTNCENPSDGAISIDRYGKRNVRRNNRNIEGAQKVHWSRNNISATMERFEPTHNSQPSSSASSLDYGFVASVVTSITDTPHLPQRKIVPSAASYEIKSLREAGPMNHVYSYAYYEPGAVKCHTNIPQNNVQTINSDSMSSNAIETSRSGPLDVTPTLLSKGNRCKSRSGQPTLSPPRVGDRHTYTTRYGTTENLYEEVNEQKIRKVLSDNRISVSPTTYVKEELRRVQHDHFRVLEELNLSLEALIMPSSPHHLSPNARMKDTVVNVASSEATGILSTSSEVISSSVTLPKKTRWFGLLGGNSSYLFPSSQPNGFINTSLENLSATFHSMELKDQSNNSANHPEFDDGDFDSGFSGSGSSSGASYNDSVRDYKPTTASLENFNINKKMYPGSSDNRVTSFESVEVCSNKQPTAMPSLPTEPLTESTRIFKKSFWAMKP